MANDLLGGGGKAAMPACTAGRHVTFGRHSDGGHRALCRPGGGIGNLRVHGVATWF
jgi:hypothetical protein